MKEEADEGMCQLTYVVGQTLGLLSRLDLRIYLIEQKFSKNEIDQLTELLSKLAKTFYVDRR